MIRSPGFTVEAFDRCLDLNELCFNDAHSNPYPMNRLTTLESRLQPYRETLLKHPIYEDINQLDRLRVFMEHHVFAVWDFMSLLKALQQKICCVSIPWLPPQNPLLCRFVNEIVLAEESDEDSNGAAASHFDLYYAAMQHCGVKTNGIDAFMAMLRGGHSVNDALQNPKVPEAAARFVRKTFEVIESGNLSDIAAAFTFGREDLLPDVFQRIVDQLNEATDGKLAPFQHYLERHIGLDGEEHGPLSRRLVETLCGDDENLWAQAETTARECLIARSELWNGIHEQIIAVC